jgi:hypothetical protein
VAFYPLAELFGGALSLFTKHPPSRFGGRFDLYGSALWRHCEALAGRPSDSVMAVLSLERSEIPRTGGLECGRRVRMTIDGRREIGTGSSDEGWARIP